MGELRGQVAVVTGGTLGIGLAAARRLGLDGASVVVCGNDAESVDSAVAGLDAEGLTISGERTDVRDPAQVERLIATVVRDHGRIDILVASAGIQRYGTVVETSIDCWDEVLEVNVRGAFLAAKYVVPHMRERGAGAIVNVSSVQAFASQANVVAYTASKGALNAMTRAMAVDHAADGIRINVVCPASVDTPMLRWAADLFKGDHAAGDVLGDWGAMHPLGRVAKPEEIAEAIAFLAGPRASFVTGTELRVDGGMLAALGVRLPG